MRAQKGDHRAFEQLYRMHLGRVYALCLRMVADPVQAETLTQDTFVRVWQRIGSYRGQGAFGAWLRRVAVNVVIEDRRSEARQVRWLERSSEVAELAADAGGSREVPGRRTGPEGRGEVTPVEAAIDLERAIAELPPGARETFVLHDVEGYRHGEIAEMTGVATGTVKAQLHRARKLLRKALEGSREVTGS